MYPEDNSLNYIIKIFIQYCDVVCFNRYRYTFAELVPPEGGDYPIIISESHFVTLETGLLQSGLRDAADQVERAEFYKYYVIRTLWNPSLVGTHWFHRVDQAVTSRSDGANYQAGFLTMGDVLQEEITGKAGNIGNSIYRLRYSGQ
jgi:hypothetical protein